METIIEFQDVKKSYLEKTVLEHFNLSVNEGEFITIVGTSGSGKTTVLKMINGLIETTQGHVIVQGKDLKEHDLIQLRRQIGYVIQGSLLFPHMTVKQNIAYVPSLSQKNHDINDKIIECMKTVQLDLNLLNRYPSELSGGQQQRVGIARALINRPQILLMDEPFSAVDEITRVQLQDELLKIYKQTSLTILFVTHDIEEALKLGTQVLVMNEGKIEQYASPDEILKHPATPFVEKLVDKQRRYCLLPEDKLQDCKYCVLTKKNS